MVEERRPTKKVVKKVVRRTVVVRPTPAARTRDVGGSKPAGSTALKPRRSVNSSLAKLKTTATTRPRLPRIPSPPRRPGAGLASRTRQLGTRVGGRARDTVGVGTDAFTRAIRWIRDLRLPRLSPMRGAAATGIVVGLIAVTLGWLARELFSATRGTSAGGTWGALALVIMAFIAYTVGRMLLTGFGIDHAGAISFTSIGLVFVLVLAFFLDLAATRYSWILLPVLCAIAFAAACKTLLLAAEQPHGV